MDLAREIQAVLELDDLETIDMDRLAANLRDILSDHAFDEMDFESKLPLLKHVQAIYTRRYHLGGRSLIPFIERILFEALLTGEVGLDALCLLYDLLYFFYWFSSSNLDGQRGFGTKVVVPFSAAIRDGSACRKLPCRASRPLGRDPLRLGYLSQFAVRWPGNAIGPFIDHVLGGLSRYFPGRYRLVLYAWMFHDEASLVPLDGTDVTVRRFKAGSMTDRIGAIASAVAADEIDILITDMNSSLPTVLFERRIAPIQIYFQFGMPFCAALKHRRCI